MIFCVILDELILMISSSNYTNEAWDRLKKIYLDTILSRKLIIFQKLLQSCQEENKNMVVYLNKIIDLRFQLVGYGCNWINENFMVFIIFQASTLNLFTS